MDRERERERLIGDGMEEERECIGNETVEERVDKIKCLIIIITFEKNPFIYVFI